MTEQNDFGQFLAKEVDELHKKLQERGGCIEFENAPYGTTGDFVSQSLTPNVMQINWRTPSLFPLCPQNPGDVPLQEYLDNLQEGKFFAKNAVWTSTVIKADFNNIRTALYIITNSDSGVKKYALAKVEYDRSTSIFYHESIGTFFEERGAEKYFTIERGYEWTGGDVLDDWC